MEQYTEISDKGFDIIGQLSTDYPSAIRLLSFIARNASPGTGSVSFTRNAMNSSFGVSSRTLVNWTRALQQAGAISTKRVSGLSGLVYTLNPDAFKVVGDGMDEGGIVRIEVTQ